MTLGEVSLGREHLVRTDLLVNFYLKVKPDNNSAISLLFKGTNNNTTYFFFILTMAAAAVVAAQQVQGAIGMPKALRDILGNRTASEGVIIKTPTGEDVCKGMAKLYLWYMGYKAIPQTICDEFQEALMRACEQTAPSWTRLAEILNVQVQCNTSNGKTWTVGEGSRMSLLEAVKDKRCYVILLPENRPEPDTLTVLVSSLVERYPPIRPPEPKRKATPQFDVPDSDDDEVEVKQKKNKTEEFVRIKTYPILTAFDVPSLEAFLKEVIASRGDRPKEGWTISIDEEVLREFGAYWTSYVIGALTPQISKSAFRAGIRAIIDGMSKRGDDGCTPVLSELSAAELKDFLDKARRRAQVQRLTGDEEFQELIMGVQLRFFEVAAKIRQAVALLHKPVNTSFRLVTATNILRDEVARIEAGLGTGATTPSKAGGTSTTEERRVYDKADKGDKESRRQYQSTWYQQQQQQQQQQFQQQQQQQQQWMQQLLANQMQQFQAQQSPFAFQPSFQPSLQPSFQPPQSNPWSPPPPPVPGQGAPLGDSSPGKGIVKGNGICFNFRDGGYCKFGDKCRFNHNISNTSLPGNFPLFPPSPPGTFQGGQPTGAQGGAPTATKGVTFYDPRNATSSAGGGNDAAKQAK